MTHCTLLYQLAKKLKELVGEIRRKEKKIYSSLQYNGKVKLISEVYECIEDSWICTSYMLLGNCD